MFASDLLIHFGVECIALFRNAVTHPTIVCPRHQYLLLRRRSPLLPVLSPNTHAPCMCPMVHYISISSDLSASCYVGSPLTKAYHLRPKLPRRKCGSHQADPEGRLGAPGLSPCPFAVALLTMTCSYSESEAASDNDRSPVIASQAQSVLCAFVFWMLLLTGIMPAGRASDDNDYVYVMVFFRYG